MDGMLAYLFYNSWIAAILLAPVSLFYLRTWIRECCHAKEVQFRMQFRDGMQLLSSALKAGYSVENAIREAEKDLRTLYPENSRIRKEFERMIRQLEMNLTVEQTLQEFAERVDQEDAGNFVTVFSVAKRTGGDSIAILKDTIRMIGEKMEVEREIQTLLTAKKLEFQVMCVIPLGMVMYMRAAFPEFLSVLYGNVSGVLLMTVCMGIYGAAYQMGKKMIQIEV